jgi:hypothetical protein
MIHVDHTHAWAMLSSSGVLKIYLNMKGLLLVILHVGGQRMELGGVRAIITFHSQVLVHMCASVHATLEGNERGESDACYLVNEESREIFGIRRVHEGNPSNSLTCTCSIACSCLCIWQGLKWPERQYYVLLNVKIRLVGRLYCPREVMNSFKFLVT